MEVSENFGFTESYIKRYSHRLVPMLELHDGTQIGESMAICRFFEASYPKPALMGVTPIEQATVEMWERRVENEGITGCEEIFRNSDQRMVGRGLPGTLEPVAQIPELIERGKGRLRRFLHRPDFQLSSNQFIAGTRFSVAQATR